MKVEIKGRNVQLLARIVISLKQFHGTVNVEMDKEKLVLRARNPLNGRSVLHIFKDDFFSVQDKCDVTSDMFVNISDMVDSFESIGAMDGESDHCVLEIADNKMNINFHCQNDHVQITLNPAAVSPVWRLESDLKVVDDKDHHAEFNDKTDDLFDSNRARDDSFGSLGQNQFVSGDDDTPAIEDLITDAEANNLPYHIIKTMKEYKKNKDDIIVID